MPFFVLLRDTGVQGLFRSLRVSFKTENLDYSPLEVTLECKRLGRI